MATANVPAHILVINDTPELLNVIRDILEDEGYRVSLDTFSDFDLNTKYRHIAELKPDLLVLDLIIGGEQLGWQLLQRIKLDPALVDMPIVLCTAAVQQVSELRPHLLTMRVATIIKPFDLDSFLSAIAKGLSGGPEYGATVAPSVGDKALESPSRKSS